MGKKRVTLLMSLPAFFKCANLEAFLLTTHILLREYGVVKDGSRAEPRCLHQEGEKVLLTRRETSQERAES